MTPMHPRDPADRPSREIPRCPQPADSSSPDGGAAAAGDLDWLAVRHLLGELDEAEMERFAAVLGADDDAVAALRRADRLLAAIAAAGSAGGTMACPPAGASRGRSGDGRAFGGHGRGRLATPWVGIGTAVAAAAVVAAVLVVGPPWRPPGHPAELLALWQSNAPPGEDDPDERAGDVSAWDDSAGDDAADAPPDWLLAAVALAEVRRQPHDSSGDPRDPSGRN